MRWRATMRYARVGLSHRGATRSGSKTRVIRPSWCETDASRTSIASARPSGPSDSLAVCSRLAWRVSAPSFGSQQANVRATEDMALAAAARFANPLGAGRKRVRRDRCGGTPKALGQSPS
jgi:hypothetical protein